MSTTFTASIFVWVDNDDHECELITCPACAAANTGTFVPHEYIYNSDTDAFDSLCYFCDTPIGEIAGLAR